MVQVLEETYQMVPNLAILAKAPIEVCIQILVAGIHKAQEAMAKV